jgi:preprotein translocase subunit SecG
VLALVSTVHVIVCLFLILVVLLQQGKGADLSVFGGGGTQAAFGARGATTLLHKLTVIGFIGFILTTMGIGLLKTSQRNASVITDLPVSAPATPGPAALEPAPAEATPAAAEATPAAAEGTPAAAEEAAEAVTEDAGGATEDDGGDQQ